MNLLNIYLICTLLSLIANYKLIDVFKSLKTKDGKLLYDLFPNKVREIIDSANVKLIDLRCFIPIVHLIPVVGVVGLSIFVKATTYDKLENSLSEYLKNMYE